MITDVRHFCRIDGEPDYMGILWNVKLFHGSSNGFLAISLLLPLFELADLLICATVSQRRGERVYFTS